MSLSARPVLDLGFLTGNVNSQHSLDMASRVSYHVD